MLAQFNATDSLRMYIYFDEFHGSQSHDIAKFIAILSTRFKINPILFLDNFENAQKLNLDSVWNAGINEIHISGNQKYVFSDTLALASRVKDDRVIICSAKFLCQSFTKVIRFINDCKYKLDEEFFANGGGNIFNISTTKLRHLGFEYVKITPKKFLQTIDSSDSTLLVNDEGDHVPNNSPNYEVYISENAVNRMYGLDRLVTSDLLFGGVKLRSCQSIYLIGSNGAVNLYDVKQKKIFQQIKADQLYLDLYPGPIEVSIDIASEKSISIPRPILLIKKLSPEHKKALKSNSRVGYIMSNYNKESYIAASIFSVISQSYENINLFFCDDVSTDHSKNYFEQFLKYVDLSKVNIEWKFNQVNRGTYWIRNDTIFNSLDKIDYYFINDSDDYSSMLRTVFQLDCFEGNKDVKAVIVDIVRTDKNYKLLSMNNEIERYGTATTAFSADLIKKIGYFQNVRKNADTEFIARIKTFYSDNALLRLPYPGLFQPFDGSNLTSDIYTIADGNSTIEVSTGMRGLHDIVWRRHHARLTLDKLPSHFAFPQSSIPLDYEKIDESFFVKGYLGFDDLILFMGRRNSKDAEFYNQLLESKHTLMFSLDHSECQFEKKGLKSFRSDLDLISAIKAYVKKSNFSGYIMSVNFLDNIAIEKITPGTLIRKNLSNHIYLLKCNADLNAINPQEERILLADLFKSKFFSGIPYLLN